MPSHPSQEPATSKHRSARRFTRLSSATGLGAALLITGAAGALHLNGLGLTTPAYAAESAGPPGFADIVQKVKPAVVSVRVRLDGRSPADGGNAPRMAQGSGFFISADGYAVTNNHVVAQATAVEITANDGKTYTAGVVGTDARTDVALLKVEGRADFPYVTFANKPMRVGDWVLVVGNPFGLGGTVTAGIVSASGRDIGSGPYDDFIQIDAPVNKGNSGGPAFDQSGNVIGVTTAIYSPSGGSVGIGFAIPADTVKSVVAQLKNRGRVSRGWIGVQAQKVTPDIADNLGLKQAEGALIAALQSNAPAARAGIASGDVITSVNGQAIKDSRELARRVAALQPGETARLGVVHNGSQKTVSVTLGAMPSEQ
jgi:serine protease Do